MDYKYVCGVLLISFVGYYFILLYKAPVGCDSGRSACRRGFCASWVSSPHRSILYIINLEKIKLIGKAARLTYRLRFWPWLRLSLLLAERSCSSGRCRETGLFCKALSQQNGALRRRTAETDSSRLLTHCRALPVPRARA